MITKKAKHSCIKLLICIWYFLITLSGLANEVNQQKCTVLETSITMTGVDTWDVTVTAQVLHHGRQTKNTIIVAHSISDDIENDLVDRYENPAMSYDCVTVGDGYIVPYYIFSIDGKMDKASLPVWPQLTAFLSHLIMLFCLCWWDDFTVDEQQSASKDRVDVETGVTPSIPKEGYHNPIVLV